MYLEDYLDEYGIPVAEFARKAKVCVATIYKVMRGENLNLDKALRIEDASKGHVRCRDIAPRVYHESLKKPLLAKGYKKKKDRTRYYRGNSANGENSDGATQLCAGAKLGGDLSENLSHNTPFSGAT
jgi:DNA-binding transcriptional regulator YdaS (Cro superfamily)